MAIDPENISSIYEKRRRECLVPLATRLESFLKECLSETLRIDRISVRAKSVARFVRKARKSSDNGLAKYSEPLEQIQDQIGARIICFYVNDVEPIEETVLEYLRPIEHRLVVPDSQSKFGYFGRHLVLLYPDDVLDSDNKPRPNVFELQIKTLFQHAWSEASHDLAYKPRVALPADIERKVAFTAAQAWGADQIFNELFVHIAANDAEQESEDVDC